MILKAAVIIAVFVAVAAANQDARQSVTSANNAFSFDLYEVLKHEGNMVVSTASVAAVLMVCYMGAGGNTATQMRNALHLPEHAQHVADGYRALVESLPDSEDVILRMANKVYIDQQFELKSDFQRTAVDSFRAGVEREDFRHAPEEARLIINDWVKNTTDGKIQDLIPEGGVDEATLMVLVNAIYFRGTWKETFDESETRPELFHLSASEQKDTQMMHQNAYYFYCGSVPGIPARAIELPYAGWHNVRMLILLPNEITGLREVESKLKELDFAQLSVCMSSQNVDLSLPKFKIESSFNLEKMLGQLGIQDIFQASTANLTGITEQNVFVNKVIQKAFIDLNENGTVAAAATALIAVGSSAAFDPPQPVKFTVDRPFVFVLLDGNNTILFVGRAVNP